MQWIDAGDEGGLAGSKIEEDLVAHRLDHFDLGLNLDGLDIAADGIGVVDVLGTDAERDFLVHVAAQLVAVAGGEDDLHVALVENHTATVGRQRAADKIHRGAADKASDELVDGLVVEVERLVDLLDQAILHDHDPVAHGHRLDLVVSDVDHRRLEAGVQLADFSAHLHAQLGIEVGQRLVKEEDLGLADNGTPHRHPLALTARKSLGLALEQFLNAENLRRLLHSRVDLVLGVLPQLETESHVLVNGHVGVERVVLKNHGDIAIFGRDVVDYRSIDRNFTASDLL